MKWHSVKNILVQFAKFGIVGVSNTILSLTVTYIVMMAFRFGFGEYQIWSLNISTAIGYIAGVLNSYYWNNKYVFKKKQENNKKKKLAKVFVCYGVTYLISMLTMDLFVEIYHMPIFFAPIPRLIVTIPFNYFANKFWAYKDFE